MQCVTVRLAPCVWGQLDMTESEKLTLRFSGSSCLPAYPGFMVMKKPTRGSRLTVLPSVKTNCFLRSRIALRTQ